MKKLRYLFVIIVFAFGMNACAQEKNNDDLAMVDNSKVIISNDYSEKAPVSTVLNTAIKFTKNQRIEWIV